MIAFLQSCTYDYNYPDSWVEQEISLSTGTIDIISLLEERGYEIATTEVYVEYFDNNGNSLRNFDYGNSRLPFTPSEDVSYFIVTIDCYGWKYGTYYKNKEKVVRLTSKRYYIKQLTNTSIHMTLSDIENTEYFV